MTIAKGDLIEVLELAKIDIREGKYTGICTAIQHAYNKVWRQNLSNHMILQGIPEFTRLKPKSSSLYSYWWRQSRRRKRIRVLNKVIKEVSKRKY